MSKPSRSLSGGQHHRYRLLSLSTAQCLSTDGLRSTIRQVVSSQGPDRRWQTQRPRCHHPRLPLAGPCIEGSLLTAMPASSSHELGVSRLPPPLRQTSNTTGVVVYLTLASPHRKASILHTVHLRTAIHSAQAPRQRAVQHTGIARAASYPAIFMARVRKPFVPIGLNRVLANHLPALDLLAQSLWISLRRYRRRSRIINRRRPSR